MPDFKNLALAFAYALTVLDSVKSKKEVHIMRDKFLMTVLAISNDGKKSSCYEGISRIQRSYEGDVFYLTKELTPEEMKIYGRNPDEDEDYMTCKVDATQYKLLVQ